MATEYTAENADDLRELVFQIEKRYLFINNKNKLLQLAPLVAVEQPTRLLQIRASLEWMLAAGVGLEGLVEESYPGDTPEQRSLLVQAAGAVLDEQAKVLTAVNEYLDEVEAGKRRCLAVDKKGEVTRFLADTECFSYEPVSLEKIRANLAVFFFLM